jgi:hypothetical protein
MKKVKEFIAEHINKMLGSLAVLALARLATVGYWFCHLLGVNAFYCDPITIRYQLFLIGGALLSVALRSSATVLFGLALAAAIVLFSHFVQLPRTPEEIYEYVLVAPFQVAIGLIVGQILIWIWAHFGSVFKGWLRKALGLIGGSGEADGAKKS